LLETSWFEFASGVYCVAFIYLGRGWLQLPPLDFIDLSQCEPWFQVWAGGYTYNTLATIPREKWHQWGVPDGAIEGLEVEFGGLRHDTFTTQMGPDGRVTTMRRGKVSSLVVAQSDSNSSNDRGYLNSSMSLLVFATAHCHTDAVTGEMVMAGSTSQGGSYSTSSRPQGRGGGYRVSN